jgi:GNAT superfamily N-acetyltransferase
VAGTAALTFADEEDDDERRALPRLQEAAAHVANMAVEARLRRGGVARALLAACEDRARACGCPSVSLVRPPSASVNCSDVQDAYFEVKERRFSKRECRQ